MDSGGTYGRRRKALPEKVCRLAEKMCGNSRSWEPTVQRLCWSEPKAHPATYHRAAVLLEILPGPLHFWPMRSVADHMSADVCDRLRRRFGALLRSNPPPS